MARSRSSAVAPQFRCHGVNHREYDPATPIAIPTAAPARRAILQRSMAPSSCSAKSVGILHQETAARSGRPSQNPWAGWGNRVSGAVGCFHGAETTS